MSRPRSHRDWFERDRAHATGPWEVRPAGGNGVSLIRSPQQAAGFYAHDSAPAFALTLLEGGGGRLGLTLGGDALEISASPGHCLVSPADTTLACEHEATMDLLLCLLPTTTVRDVLLEHGRHAGEVSFGRLHTSPFRDDLVATLSRRLWQEAAGDDPLGALFVGQAVHTLILALVRATGEHLTAELQQKGGLPPWQVRRACDYLRAHLDEDVSLDALAGLVRLSPAHFCRAFKQSTGLPPHRWQLARRVEGARALLTDTDLPVIEVAARVGYEDPNQLARVFRKHLGTSPGQYRRERKN
ncbi:MAG TPA: AraC family transcriptional regulator [Rhodopila sp.]|uniref:AraC family transcriptional regulator n=1 Tax=Rhodopila sp. TaxID=2480087 RepID=UPI002CCBBD86|nr:AraC family transcriptional regulator [Rhodopila sp.]HVY15241.1 AraC family transcriptional regulator [Rhodopila sp.]